MYFQFFVLFVLSCYCCQRIIRGILFPSFTKILRTLFTFVDQSDSFVGKVVASGLDRAEIYGK